MYGRAAHSAAAGWTAGYPTRERGGGAWFSHLPVLSGTERVLVAAGAGAGAGAGGSTPRAAPAGAPVGVGSIVRVLSQGQSRLRLGVTDACSGCRRAHGRAGRPELRAKQEGVAGHAARGARHGAGVTVQAGDGWRAEAAPRRVWPVPGSPGAPDKEGRVSRGDARVEMKLSAQDETVGRARAGVDEDEGVNKAVRPTAHRLGGASHPGRRGASLRLPRS